MTRVTAVIPCYNGERYVAQAIASVHAQTRPVDEVLVIDDRSTDGSREVAEAAGARVVLQEQNSGPSEARNTGLRLAQGEVVAFLDADDVWAPTHCALVVGLLEQAPEAVLGFGRSAYTALPHLVSPATMPAGRPVDALELMMYENLVTQSAAVVRRRVALDVGGYEASMRHSEDYHLWLRMAATGPFVCTHEITCWRAMHAAQASRDVLAMRRGAWRARSTTLELLKQRGDARYAAAWRAAVAGWRFEMRESWYDESPHGLDATLAVGRDHGLPAGPYWAGLGLRYVLWHPRQLARYVWRRARGRRVPDAVVS